MQPRCIIKVHVALNTPVQLCQGPIIAPIAVFVLQGPSEPFHLGIVPTPAAAIHVDPESRLIPALFLGHAEHFQKQAVAFH